MYNSTDATKGDDWPGMSATEISGKINEHYDERFSGGDVFSVAVKMYDENRLKKTFFYQENIAGRVCTGYYFRTDYPANPEITPPTKNHLKYRRSDYAFFLKPKARELMQYLFPVGFGPSLKTWPKWPPHFAQITSTLFIRRVLSGLNSTAPFFAS